MQEKYEKKSNKNTITPYKEMIYKRIDDFIKSKKTTITKKDLGNKVGYTDTGFHRAIMEGSISLGVFIDLCKELNVIPGFFFTEDYDPKHGDFLKSKDQNTISKKEYDEMQDRLLKQIEKLSESMHELIMRNGDRGEGTTYSKRQTGS